jgi:hypothetical protein
MENKFDDVMAKHSDETLIKILNGPPDDYQPAALVAAKREFDKRNLSNVRVETLKIDVEVQKHKDISRASEPLSVVLKILSFVFPGIVPLIVAWSFKADGYDRKAKSVITWTLYGLGFYFAITIFIMIMGRGWW